MAQPAGKPVVDTHNHFWDIERSDLYWMRPDQTMLRRSFTPADLRPEMEAVGVDRSVIVQAAHSDWDNRWWLRLTEEYPFVGAVIGWVDLARPDVGAVLDDYRRHPAFRGVRATAEDVNDPDWIVSPAVQRGIGEVAARDLALDLLVRTPHLPHVPRLAEAFPDLRMVVDHLAKPPIAGGDLDPWYRGMEDLTPYPHLSCKLSGLLTEAGPDPTAATIRPVVQFALDTFGALRLLWGSDWPVCLLAADYQTTFRIMTEALGPLPEHQRAQIFGGNAAQFYRLG